MNMRLDEALIKRLQDRRTQKDLPHNLLKGYDSPRNSRYHKTPYKFRFKDNAVKEKLPPMMRYGYDEAAKALDELIEAYQSSVFKSDIGPRKDDIFKRDDGSVGNGGRIRRELTDEG